MLKISQLPFCDFSKWWSELLAAHQFFFNRLSITVLNTVGNINRALIILQWSWQCFTSPDVEVSRGPQCEHEGGCRGRRLGDGPRLWGSVYFLEWVALWGKDGAQLLVHKSTLFLNLCCRMTCPSRSRGGEPRPSRVQDVKSTSGGRCVETNKSLGDVEICRSECGCCVATGRGSESWTQVVRQRVAPNMGNIRWWHWQRHLKCCAFSRYWHGDTINSCSG